MNFETQKSKDVKKMTLAEMNDFSAFLRQKIIDITLKNGGHLASNLGVVELTVALHHSFDFEKDKIVWDVGHQTYVHKLLSGRKALMENLRHDGGASGFPSRVEGDLFTTGHSGTSLSMALGLARGRDLCGEDYNVLAVIGDGAFTSGEIYEALNDLGGRPTRLMIVLNDNKMSISRNVGAMSQYFNKLRVNKKFVDIKSGFKKDAAQLPFVGKPLVRLMTGVKNKIKEGFVGNKFFERFGLKYYGPFDGHDISAMTQVFSHAATAQGPVIIHLLTGKGRGLKEAELHPELYHGISPQSEHKDKSMSAAAGSALVSLADKNIAVITAAMSDGLCFNEFAHRFPDRFFDVAIAEQHAVSLCAGLARSGIKPFFGVYSTFLQRGFDQVLHDVCLNDLPVTFLIDRAGAVGADGVTHQGIFDLSYLSLIPGLIIASPKDGSELSAMIEFSLNVDHPMAIRYAKSYNSDVPGKKIELGKWEVTRDIESPVTVLAVGRTNELAASVSGARIVNARFVSPLDFELLDSLTGTVITLEDNVLRGGFGESVRTYLYGKNKVVTLGHKNEFSDIRDIGKMYENSGLTAKSLQKIIDYELNLLEKAGKL